MRVDRHPQAVEHWKRLKVRAGGNVYADSTRESPSRLEKGVPSDFSWSLPLDGVPLRCGTSL